MSLSARQRRALWSRESTNSYLAGRGNNPICNLCDQPVEPGQDFDASHWEGRPRAFGFRATGIAHRRCNRMHGALTVTPAVAKSNRVKDRHHGVTGPGLGRHALPGGKRSRLRKTIRGQVVPRLSASEKHAIAMARRWPATPGDGPAEQYQK